MENKILDFHKLKFLIYLLKQQFYSHITVSPFTHLIVNARVGNELAKSLTDVLGWSRPFTPEIMSLELFSAMQESKILEGKNNIWVSKIRISTIGDYYFIHSAHPTNQANAIFFGPDTYRFVNALNHYFSLKAKPIDRAIDIGTGCGPASIILSRLFPQAEVIGVDINETALEFSRFNAEINDCANIQFIQSNLLNNIQGDFDFITSNPPFLIDKSKRSYRHGGGTYGYKLALDIVDCALERLKPGGSLLLYTGTVIIDGKDLFFEEIRSKLNGILITYEYEEIDPDIFPEELLLEPYHSADRIAAVVLILEKPPA